MNIDEALVADRLREITKKTEYEVFMPLNSQMKNIDLLLVKLKGYKSTSIQVKGSRTYEPKKSEVMRFGEGSAAWFIITAEAIFNFVNNVDYFIFVLHSYGDSETKKTIEVNYLIVPIRDFQEITEKKAIRKGDKYHYYFWIDSRGNRSIEFNNPNGKTFSFSKYLNNWDLLFG